MSCPSSTILPSVGCSKPAISRSVVVFPQPEGPRREKNSPPGMSSVIPSTAATSAKRFTRSTSSTWPLLMPWIVMLALELRGPVASRRRDLLLGIEEGEGGHPRGQGHARRFHLEL